VLSYLATSSTRRVAIKAFTGPYFEGLPLSRPLVSASALIAAGGKVLLVRRGREPEPDAWSLPAGLVNWGERTEETAVRETYEETGVRVAVEGLLGVYDLIGPGYHYVVVCYRCRPLTSNVRPGPDVEEAKWFGLRELRSLKLMSVTKKALSDAGLLPRGPSTPSCREGHPPRP